MSSTLGQRVKLVRKHVGLTQAEFGATIGANRTIVKNIELDQLARPEQKDPLLRLICKSYGIDYFWLTTGEGEMIHVSENALADHINDLLEGENETAKALFRGLAALDEGDWKVVQKFIDAIKDKKKEAE